VLRVVAIIIFPAFVSSLTSLKPRDNGQYRLLSSLVTGMSGGVEMPTMSLCRPQISLSLTVYP
jgi:hypothetical protein